jgi:integrase/recombinase XerD
MRRLASNTTDFAALLQKFFVKFLIKESNVSQRTVESYRDTFRLLLSYMQQVLHRAPATLTLKDFSSNIISDFLDYLEEVRGNCIRSRNARLAAIHTFYNYVITEKPDRAKMAKSILAIPTKRFEKPLLGFLSRDEMKAVLAAPDTLTWAGRRDTAMFAVLYNTGARVSELTHIRVKDVQIMDGAHCVKLHGKGRKQRTIPLWRETVSIVRSWIKSESLNDEQLLFTNRFQGELTRGSVAERFGLAVAKAQESCPQLRGRHVTCHTVRHTTAMHMLQAGLAIEVLSLWLGHESTETTMEYVEADLKMKERALKAVAPPGTRRPVYKASDATLQFLDSLLK